MGSPLAGSSPEYELSLGNGKRDAKVFAPLGYVREDPL